MNIITIIGARPQFIKAAMVSRAIAVHNQQVGLKEIKETILHTGQHYDSNMSEIFFEQMRIPKPSYNLNIGSGSHGETTGKMLMGIEKIIFKEKPDWVLVYGDTNSTLAGALVASKLHVPIAHVEAGLRSFNKGMPEEINRILTDHISSVFFCPTTTAVQNLANEGIIKNVHHVGDVMYDAALEFGALAERQSFILEQLSLTSKAYILATVHRAENTDNPERLTKIFQLFCKIATEDVPVILPIHPRTKNALLKNTIAYEKVSLVENSAIPNLLGFTNPNVITIPPVSFLDMVMLEKNAKAIMTDSGGVQKEAYFHKVPCVTLRSETEWVETVNAGWNIVAFDNKKIQIDGDFFDSTQYRSTIYEYGAGSASYNILKVLSK